MSIPLVLTLIGIAFAIFAGAKLKINTGIAGIACALVIGILFVKMTPTTVVNYWPFSILFWIIIVTLFYGFPTKNGTMEVVADKMLRLMGGRTSLLLPVSFIACAVLGFMGAPGNILIGPVVYSIAIEYGVSPIAVTMILALSSMVGGDNPITGQGGIVSRGLMQKAGYAQAEDWAFRIWAMSAIKQVIACALIYIIFKCWKGKRVTSMGEPKKFDPLQKKTMMVILISLVIVVLPYILGLFTKAPWITTLKNFCDVQVIFSIGIIVMCLIKAASFEDAVKSVPVSLLIMIGGMNLLMGVAKDAGLITSIGSFLSNSVPKILIPPVIVIIAGFLSFFSGGISVVCPLLYPIVPALVQGTGLNPVMLFTCIFIGAMSSSSSPFSRGGATCIGTCPDPKVQAELVLTTLPITVFVWLLCAVLAFVGFFNLLAPPM